MAEKNQINRINPFPYYLGSKLLNPLRGATRIAINFTLIIHKFPLTSISMVGKMEKIVRKLTKLKKVPDYTDKNPLILPHSTIDNPSIVHR